MARTATARVRAATAPQGTRAGAGRTKAASPLPETSMAATAMSAAAQNQGSNQGQSVPAARPITALMSKVAGT